MKFKFLSIEDILKIFNHLFLIIEFINMSHIKFFIFFMNFFLK
jgi:hypothetical protein